MLYDIFQKKFLLTINCDDQPAITVINQTGGKGRTKHLDMKMKKLVQVFKENERCTLYYVPTKSNIADGFTKALSHGFFMAHRTRYLQ